MDPIIAAFLLGLNNTSGSLGGVCKHEVTSVRQLVGELLLKPSNEVVLKTDSLISIADPEQKAVWTFGKLSDATPVITCRHVVERNGSFFVDTQALCAGTPKMCSEYISRFKG